jgi:predicted transcriptional regulator
VSIMEDKITLDRDAFKVLASDTRIGILKSIKQQRKTLSELAKEFNMSVSTVKEHLDNLVGAELIIQRDEGHKWKYYDLTRKGNNILNPGETRIWVLLSASASAATGIAYDMVSRFVQPAPMLANRGAEKVFDALEQALPAAAEPAMALPWIHIGLLVTSVIVFGVTLGYFLASRKRILF